MGRSQRAEKRLTSLLEALTRGAWKKIFEIAWAEFIDMHDLFFSAEFHYLNEKTKLVLNYLKAHWLEKNDGPIVTMDAGPNVHLLFRLDQIEQYRAIETALGARFQLCSEKTQSTSNYDMEVGVPSNVFKDIKF